jgi:hypothetical protein
MIDTKQYRPARQNMIFVTRSLRSLANNLHILAQQADICGINQLTYMQICQTTCFCYCISKTKTGSDKIRKKTLYWSSPVHIIQLLHLNLINMRFYGAEYNNIELVFASFNIVVLCSIKPHIDQVQV